MLVPVERKIVLNAAEAPGDGAPLRGFRFTVAHEVGHWVCHCLEGRAPAMEPSYCRPVDLTEAADRTLERDGNVFAAELLMPEPVLREAWEEPADVAGCATRFDVVSDSDAVAAS
jgi:Zn-dependent peptidase ImmA (M78 family)